MTRRNKRLAAGLFVILQGMTETFRQPGRVRAEGVLKSIIVILLSLLLPLPSEAKDCALLLAAPPRQLPVVTPDRAFQAYMEDLLADVILETEDLLVLKEGLEQGFVPNPITDAVIFRNSEAHVHVDAFQARIERGNLSVAEQLRWVDEQIAKREYNRERQRVTREETHEITLEDLFPKARMVAIKGEVSPWGVPRVRGEEKTTRSR